MKKNIGQFTGKSTLIYGIRRTTSKYYKKVSNTMIISIIFQFTFQNNKK